MTRKPTTLAARGAMLLVSLFCLLSMTGCFGVDGKFRAVRDTIISGTNADYEVDAEFGLGSGVLGLASGILNLIGGDEDPDIDVAIDLLDQIESVQIGSYYLSNFDFDRDQIHQNAKTLINYMEDRDYDSIVRSYEGNSVSLIMVRMNPSNPEKLNEIVVLDISQSDLSIVQLQGNIDEIVDVATRERKVPGVEQAIEETGE